MPVLLGLLVTLLLGGGAPAVDRTAPLAVLREWDAARAEAWSRGDPAALRRLYAEGSASGRADRVLLAAYRSRGLRVVDLRVQRSGVLVVSATARRLVLVVTDRVVGAAAVGDGVRLPLPRDDWSTRTLALVRTAVGWQVEEVWDQARPVASTDVTSRSANS